MSRPASKLARLAAGLLAVLLPCVVVASSIVAMEGYRSFADQREDRNAGKVINGRVVQVGVRQMIEDTLDQHEPQVIVLGNSLSNTDILPSLLARGLGVEKSQVQKFSVPNSIAAHWYAILKNRVYARGHRPKLVIIHSDMQSLLAVTPRSEASYLNLSVHLEPYEPLIDEKLGGRLWYLQRVRENRGKVREEALTTARNTMVDLLYHGSLEPTDDRETERALKRVFDDDRVDMRLHNQVIPIFNQAKDRDLLPFDPATLPMPKDSFLPEISRMVRKNGGTVVFVRPPMSPLLPEGVGDVVLPAAERKVHRTVSRHGAMYVDMRALDMSAGHFHNLDHMNTEGARRFTQVLADTLVEVGAWENQRRQRDIDLLVPTAIVDGVLVNVEPDVAFRGRTPAVPRADRPVSKGRGRTAYFQTESFAFLSDNTTLELTRHASRCSPIRVLEDGEPLPYPNATCEEVVKHGQGRICHAAEKVYFTTPDETNPLTNGRTYTLALDDARFCHGARWLYPGDHMRLALPPDALDGLNRGVGALVVRVRDMSTEQLGADPARLRVKVRVGQGVRADQVLEVERQPGRAHSLAIEPRLGPGAQNVTVDFINQSDRFLLVTGARIVESGRGS